MIALLIVGIGIVAVIDATNKHMVAQSDLEKKVLADWVASNVLDMARFESLTDRVKSGSQSDSVDMGGHRWRTRLTMESTDVEGVFLARVEVRLQGDASNRVISSLTTALAENR